MTTAHDPDRVAALTECCEREIDGKTDRYCPKCGWECRIKPQATQALASAEARQEHTDE